MAQKIVYIVCINAFSMARCCLLEFTGEQKDQNVYYVIIKEKSQSGRSMQMYLFLLHLFTIEQECFWFACS